MPRSEKGIENAKQYNLAYKKKTYKRVPLDMRIEDYDILKAHCDNIGVPIQTFIKQAIQDKISKSK